MRNTRGDRNAMRFRANTEKMSMNRCKHSDNHRCAAHCTALPCASLARNVRRFAGGLLVLGVLAMNLTAAESQVVYHETFDHYGYTLPGFSACCGTGEWPPSLKHLEFRPTKPESVYQPGFCSLPLAAQGLTDYEFAFRVRFAKDRPKAIDFRLEFAADDDAKRSKTSPCMLRISDEQSGVMNVGGSEALLPAVRTAMKETPFSPLLGGCFYQVIVRVRGQRLEAFLEGQGKRVRIGAAEVAGRPLVGFNFNGTTPFDLDDILVRKLAGAAAEDSRDTSGAAQVAAPRPWAKPAAAPAFVATRAGEYTLAFPTSDNTASATVRLGHPGEMRIRLKWADDSTTVLSVSTSGTTMMKPVIKEQTAIEDGKPVVQRKQLTEPLALPDAGLTFREIGEKGARGAWQLHCHIRPWIEGYLDDDKLAVAANWEKYEAASQHFFKFEVRRDARGIEQWIDGRYVGRRDSATPLTAITFVLPADGVVHEAATRRIKRDDAFLPLDIVPIANPGVMAAAKLPMPPGENRVGSIPFVVAPGSGNLDLSVVRENFGTWALECDFYLSRTAFSGMPESLMLSVPAAQYHKAHILCAVADDPSRDPVLTARLTRFLSGSAGGRGPAIADTTIELPRAGQQPTALPPGVKKVGDVEYTADGRPHKVPLYLVEVPLDCGKIQDVLFQEPARTYAMIPQPYLDFEVLGKTEGVLQQLNKQHKPHPTSRSAVHVFGVTLQRSPVEMEIVPARSGNAYLVGEKPSMNVVLRGRGKGECRVVWDVRDVDGKPVASDKHAVRFAAAGEEQTIAVTPALNAVGHFKAHFRLLDAGGSLLVEHTAPCAVVAPDTRKAGYGSPYFSWWFNGAHLTSNDINVVGPLLKMAGIRRTLVKSEAGAEPWQLTNGQIGNFTRSTSPDNLEKNRTDYAKRIDDALKAFPHVNAANIFHESCNGPFPLELYGIAMPLPTDEKQLAHQKNMVAGATLTAQLYREKCPQVRPTLVNTGESLGGAGMLMRHKIPREALTALGEESLGQTMPPETSTATNFWMLRELARKMGYGDVPVEACYEWKGRGIRDLGERKVAAWRLRDALIAHAWGCRLVPMSGVITPGNSYHNSIWGHDYMFSRSPENYPYVSFSTTAHFTQLLDGAKFARRVPTGSITVYAVEFTRGQERVYALWTARGTAEVQLDFSGDVKVQYSDMFGRGRELATGNKTLTLTASGEPCYLVAPVAVKSIAVGKRTYPDDRPPSGGVQVADAISALERWELAAKPDERLENVPRLGNTNYLAFRQLGKYELSAVKDDEKGDCLEVELVQQNDIVPFLPEYSVMQLKTPVAIEGAPTTVGVWVKGNSGWGQLMWELSDAEGERWLSCGTSGYWCDIYDWPRQAAINFDGWNFVQFPLTQASPVKLPNAGEVAMQWRTSGGGNGRIDYPIKLTGLAINMTRQALDLKEMKPVRTVVRLRDLSAY